MAAADPVAAARRVVVVAGMHRAGTSAVARGLMALGLDLGDALMAADANMNARGFFEDVDVVALDDALLEAAGADWKCIAPLDRVDWTAPRYADARDRAVRLLDARLGPRGNFAFKDPRAVRLLPFWRRVFADVGAEDAYVIAVRHPQAVIDSLTARDSLDPRRSGWLWHVHLVCALHHTRGRPRVVVDYDELLAAPRPALARIARALELSADVLARGDVDAYARDFLTTDLRHAAYAPDDLRSDALPPGAADAHALAQRLARDALEPDAPAATAEVDRLYAGLRQVSPLLDYASDVERVADRLPRVEGELRWARDALAQASSYATDLAQALATTQAHAESLEATLQRKEADLVAMHTMLQRVGADYLGRLVLRKLRRNPAS